MGLLSFLRSMGTAAGAGFSQRYLRSRDFENRLIRARQDDLHVKGYLSVSKNEAVIENRESGNMHKVSMTGCDCEDFMKKRVPCKHMIYLMLKNGRYAELEKKVPDNVRNGEEPDEFTPIYWQYYDGPPTGIGYASFYQYEVVGRKYGVSEKTRKPTNKKSRIVVLANNVEDAISEAKKKDTLPPYETVTLLDRSPSFEQIKYLNGAGIPHPNLMCDIDVTALLTCYKEEDDSRATVGIKEIARKRRVCFSMFSSQKQIAAYIMNSMDDAEKVRFYCYAVYCQEKGLEVGETKLQYTDSIFSGFTLTKKQINYIRYTLPGYARLDGRAGAYKAAKEYILANKISEKK